MEWRPVRGFEGEYLVSDSGQAKNSRLRADLEYEREHANAYYEECGQWEAENEKLRAEVEQERDHRIHAEQHADAFLRDCERLNAQLERVTAERDAAIKDLNEFLSMDELCPIQCEWCKWNGTYCDGKTPEWRGVQNE